MVNTSDSDHKDDSRFSGDIVSTSSSSLSFLVNDMLLFSNISLVVSFSSLGIISGSSLDLFLSLLVPFLSDFSELCVSGSLLEVGFGDFSFGLFDLH